jgi:pyruvate/2-oxoglutarate dehydrogenase complex dihydrolipoamide dehydrogenase (E3) component
LVIQDIERKREISADFVIVATGTAPSRPSSVPFEDGVIVDSNGLTTLKELPKSLIVVGTGVIGTEYASMLALLRIGEEVISTEKLPNGKVCAHSLALIASARIRAISLLQPAK